MTPSEKLIASLCDETFLSFWSFPTPRGKKNKELCDLLVVCEPDIIIFSVKDISIKESGDILLDNERWIRKAIQESANQIYGAERIIGLKEEIFLSDAITSIKLPDKEIRKVYRVAIAFGRGDKFNMPYGDFGKGFVHVFDETSTRIILQELDTITDFKKYLDATEELILSGNRLFSFGSEDSLAFYLQNSNSFNTGSNLMILQNDIWDGYSKSKEYIEEKSANVISYHWDSFIKTFYTDFNKGHLTPGIKRHELELALRQMNKETRFTRRQLSMSINEMLGNDDGTKTPVSRIMKTETDDSVLYVFLTRPIEDRELRVKELEMRCLVARSMNKNVPIVIGIATEKYKKGAGFSFDICYHNFPVWTEELEKQAQYIMEEFGYFKKPNLFRLKPDGEKHPIH